MKNWVIHKDRTQAWRSDDVGAGWARDADYRVKFCASRGASDTAKEYLRDPADKLAAWQFDTIEDAMRAADKAWPLN